MTDARQWGWSEPMQACPPCEDGGRHEWRGRDYDPARNVLTGLPGLACRHCGAIATRNENGIWEYVRRMLFNYSPWDFSDVDRELTVDRFGILRWQAFSA